MESLLDCASFEIYVSPSFIFSFDYVAANEVRHMISWTRASRQQRTRVDQSCCHLSLRELQILCLPSLSSMLSPLICFNWLYRTDEEVLSVPGSLINTAWYFVKGLLAARTLAKISALGSSIMDDINKEIPKTSIPSFASHCLTIV
jgi:hypothetical protein